jgi:hypothetical protein
MNASGITQPPASSSSGSGVQNSQGIPVYEVLEFLDWCDRFVALAALRFIAADYFEKSMNPLWVNRRLLAEKNIIVSICAAPTLESITVACSNSGFLEKSSIPVKIQFAAVLDPKVPVTFDNYSSQYRTHRWIRSSFPIQHHLLSQRIGISRTSFGDQEYLDVWIPRGYNRAFKVNKLCTLGSVPLVGKSVFRDFVNGANICCLLVGSRFMIPDMVVSIIRHLHENTEPDIHRRLSFHRATFEDSCFEVSIFSIAGNTLNSVYCEGGALDFGAICRLAGSQINAAAFTCFQVRLVSYFAKPVPNGFENTLTLLIPPSNAEGHPVSSKRDMSAMSRCLLARQSKSYVPIRDSFLTRYLQISKFRQIHVLSAIGGDVLSDHNEAVHGLRYADAVCNSHTDLVGKHTVFK